jgi:hypothetical protein
VVGIFTVTRKKKGKEKKTLLHLGKVRKKRKDRFSLKRTL